MVKIRAVGPRRQSQLGVHADAPELVEIGRNWGARDREFKQRVRTHVRVSEVVGVEHVLESAAVLRGAFEPHLHLDWSTRAGDLQWTCLETLLHACDFWYSVELATQAATWLPPLLAWRENVDAEQGLAAHDAAAALLSAVMRGMPPHARAFHGQRVDASGFAAMHCDEVLVHGFDIAQGLGIDFSPPSDLVAAIRDRLFPWSPRGDPWATLLWCNGRVALPGHERLVEWSWHPAPLDEWDGSRRGLTS